MSLNRYAPKRDQNEPAIRKRFATHGWHTEQLSGAGMPDLLCWSKRRLDVLLVDVKMPGKKATKTQVEKWAALSEKGIPVYVASTEADVDAIVGGTATPWEPEVRGSIRAPRPHGNERRKRKASIGGHHVAPSAFYLPPRSTPVDAPALAAETFAPPEMCSAPRCYQDLPCPRHSLSAPGWP